MGRRASGWTVVKKIAREVDRANRQAHREAISTQKAYIREQERAIREQQKYLDSVTREGSRTQEKFNKALAIANASTNIPTKEEKLNEAKQLLSHLKKLQQEHNFFHFQNLNEVEKSIDAVQKELNSLKTQERERLSLEKSTLFNTQKACQIREGIDNVLLHTLDINDALDWETLKDTQPFLIPEPTKPPKPMLPPEPALINIPAEPDRSTKTYAPKIPLYLHLFKEKKQALLAEALKAYEEDFNEWKILSEKIKSDNDLALKSWEKNKSQVIKKWEEGYKNTCNDWKKRKEEHEYNQVQYNGGLEKLKQEYESNNKEAIEEYCRLVLARSEYPFSFSRDYQIEYNSETKLLALDYQLPTIDIVPVLKEEKFIKSRAEVKKTYITEKQQKEIYESLLYKMTVRTIHEIFESDVVNPHSGVRV